MEKKTVKKYTKEEKEKSKGRFNYTSDLGLIFIKKSKDDKKVEEKSTEKE